MADDNPASKRQIHPPNRWKRIIQRKPGGNTMDVYESYIAYCNLKGERKQ